MLEFLEKVLWATMPLPPLYGWFHLLMAGLFVAGCALVIVFRKKIDERRFRILTACLLGVMVFLEIIKQIVLGFGSLREYTGYGWYVFPFQFCSSPYYVWPFVLFVKNERIKKCLYAFVGTYSLFGGLVNMIYPGDILTVFTWINIQTTIHHGSRMLLGVAAYACGLVESKLKAILDATAVFGILLVIAMILNESMVSVVDGQTFNMFFISRHYPCSLPVLSLFWTGSPETSLVPYPVFLLVYIFGFMLIAAILWAIPQGIARLANKVKHRTHRVNN